MSFLFGFFSPNFDQSFPIGSEMGQATIRRRSGPGRGYDVAYEVRRDDAPPRRLELGLDVDLPLAHLAAHYDAGRALHLHAGVSDKRRAVLRLDDDVGAGVGHGDRLNAAGAPLFEFFLRLNHSQLLTSRSDRWQSPCSFVFTGLN